jgi:hypothetical protein
MRSSNSLTVRSYLFAAVSCVQPLIIYVFSNPVTDEEIRAVYEQFMRKYPNGEMTKEVRNQNIY